MDSNSKKILVIAYYWPPSGGPGAIRVVKWVKYLVRLGWSPIILTVKDGEFPYRDPALADDLPSSVPVYRTHAPGPFVWYKRLTGKKKTESLPVGVLTYQKTGLLEKLAAWIRCNLWIPDARLGWVRPATKMASRLIRENNIDHVLISSPPHSSQLVGLRLKKKCRVHWVADLRDPWTHIRYYKAVSRSALTRRLDSLYEKRVLGSADVVTTVSPALLREFKELGGASSNVQVILNGFDPDDFSLTPMVQAAHFRIVHTGNLLENQNPDVLWKALNGVFKLHPEWREMVEIRLSGRTHQVVLEALEDLGLGDQVIQRSFRPHNQILPEIINASLLIVSIPNVSDNAGIVTGKLLEYTGSGRPILVIGPTDGDAARIAGSLSNSRAVAYDQVEACQEFLMTLIQAWKKNDLPLSGNAEREPYSRIRAVLQLIQLMENRS